jgi:hypothetical protein
VPEAEPDPAFSPGRGGLRGELLAALEICGLTGLAFTRPVLDSFGRAPETFLARGAAPLDVVLFAITVAVVPALVLAVAGALTRLTGPRVRRWVHLVTVGVLGGVVVWRFGADVASVRPLALAAAGAVGGAALVVLRHRVRPTAVYLRFLGAASAVFLLQFLVLSPSSSLASGGDGPPLDPAATDAVLAATDGEPPPIVMVVADALPTATLLDGAGNIDGELFPNLDRLAGGATWYRNHTTTSGWTFQAVPSMLTGQLPQNPSPLPSAAAYPDNLFTLFAGTHDIQAVEQITRLCPGEVCAPRGQGATAALLGDAVDWWRGAAETDGGGDGGGAVEGADMLPGALEPDRGEDFARWVDDQDFSPGGDPGLWLYHLLMPHDPWDVLDDMTPYASVQEEPFGLYLHNFWGEVGAEVAHQRQVLQAQAVDRQLGHLFAELDAAGTYDETLIVVTGDHGEAFTDNRPLRGLTSAQYEQVAWTPLIVKAPAQAQGVVDDANVWNVDLVPTIAETLGIDLAWDFDGVPASQADVVRAAGDKQMLDSEMHELEPDEDGQFVPIDGREGLERLMTADAVPGQGEHAVWQRTEHGGLVGRRVDDLDVEMDGGVGTLAVEQLDRIEDQGDRSPLLELVARCELQPGQVVAVTVNDVVAAVAPVEPAAAGADDDARIVHALLLPDSFAADNDVTAYLVEGAPGAETLRLITVLAD